MVLAACMARLAIAAPALNTRASPTVDIEYATVVGSSLLGIDSFKGIPFAQPPVNQLRLKPPQPITTHLGTVTATGTPLSCPQMQEDNSGNLLGDVIGDLQNSPLFQAITASGEDCLTVNVQRPSSATTNSKLPVVFWIFGGGWESGSTQGYDASNLISTSVAQGQDILYVSVNYRLGGFGFLPGAEVLKDGVSNLGLLDQRLGLQWVADNIAQFGGDPEKVTIWGESAGSVSVFDHMVMYDGDNTYKGKPLFRAAMMNSGTIFPTDPVDCQKGQAVYDQVVSAAGCSSSLDTLECLRDLDYETYLSAANSVPSLLGYTSVAVSYLPRPDGVILTDSPDALISAGKYTKIPFIVGDQEDEGTGFALFQSNITTTDLLISYLSDIFFHSATTEQIQELVTLYPEDPAAGAPYNTGDLYELYPQFKRIASLLGDYTFTIMRRVFLSVVSKQSPTVPSWSFLSSYDDIIPILGTFHGSDLFVSYGIVPGFPTTSVQSYFISFINSMDPNNGTTGQIEWPQWNAEQELLNFNALSNALIPDSFRAEVFDFFVDNLPSLHL